MVDEEPKRERELPGLNVRYLSDENASRVFNIKVKVCDKDDKVREVSAEDVSVAFVIENMPLEDKDKRKLPDIGVVHVQCGGQVLPPKTISVRAQRAINKGSNLVEMELRLERIPGDSKTLGVLLRNDRMVLMLKVGDRLAPLSLRTDVEIEKVQAATAAAE